MRAKREALTVVYRTLLLTLHRLHQADPDKTQTAVLVALADKTRELARLTHQVPVRTENRA
ncbi:hypothetical protein CSW14_07050 [Thermus scotoductus]|uniref:Uncharacterized protein n=2 Tax=Thermus TaxID=270 RepID=A0A7V4A184_9DEIN|nr:MULTISPECIES: hypothetical protein [Thermus]RTI54785.1 hypothetical protein CSW14_07050 [Thermus scotoductus]